MQEGGSGSLGTWLVIVLVLGAILSLGWYHRHLRQQQIAAELAFERQALREQQLRVVAGDLGEAARSLQRAEPDAISTTLRQMDEKLQILASAANAAGDTMDAARIAKLREPVRGAIASIEAAEPGDTRMAAARTALDDLGEALAPWGGDVAPAAP